MSSPTHSPSNPFRDTAPGDYAESPQHMQDLSQDTSGLVSSADASRPGSAGGRRREKKRVGFTGGTDSAERSPRSSWSGGRSGAFASPPNIGVTPPLDSSEVSGATTPNHSRHGSGDLMLPQDSSRSHLPELSPQQTQEIHNAFNQSLPIPRPRPAIRRTTSGESSKADPVEAAIDEPVDDPERVYRQGKAREAYERGKRLETDERVRSTSNSRYTSPERTSRSSRPRVRGGDIPLEDLSHKFDGAESDSDDLLQVPQADRSEKIAFTAEAHKLVRKHTFHHGAISDDTPPPEPHSGAVTPTEERAFDEEYIRQPEHYRGGILGSLLKLYGPQSQNGGGHSRSSSATRVPSGYASGDLSTATTPTHSPPESGTVTPSGSNWFGRKHKDHSTSSLAHLIGSSASLGSPVISGLGEQVTARLKEQRDQEKLRRPGVGKRTRSGNAMAAFNRISRPRLEDEIRITVHIAETIQRQRYLIKLCKALMQYGAPTHRLEEYMNMSARVLEIQAQFLYIPGSMIMSFDDPSTHTTEVKLVRIAQGLDLGKLSDVHEVYKDVVHDRVGVEEATLRLKEVTEKRDKHSRWFRVPVYGLAAVCVGPFAFSARLIDLPIAFLLGCILGILQLIVAPRSDLYANVFEIAATVITSFLARAFGSIPDGNGGRLFCFSALAQSSIALILPGYIVLCASLELQSRSIVAGSIRMVYAIIYSLFLGFGITIGMAIYGIMDSNATSAITCKDPLKEPYFFPFVPGFAMCLIVINQAKWKQAPVMLVIAFIGYLVSFFSSKRFAGNTQVSSTLGALAIGVMANTYSRVGSRLENWILDIWEDKLRHYWKDFKRRVLHIKARAKSSTKALEEGNAHDGESMYVRQTRRVGYGLAAAAMLPAIFVQVPSGLAVSGSLVSGIASADQIAGNATNGTTVVNSTTLTLSTTGLNSIAFNVGYSVIQVAIGITVGLFLSAIVVYPLGKRRSGLFSF
ncbi:hypothetical protein LTR36_001590 [Oleoguttula mirabilis]|uniref:Threonine/serine exporter-like N-terminal domain-containing protein n=1 Tax=Oleoguttula mirabilis TaxID=1507867 RepID=A0AAV9JNC5_9PEZI|nr:hypothetical protein LTR36_001590 [Oleoguttula mirabilis]